MTRQYCYFLGRFPKIITDKYIVRVMCFYYEYLMYTKYIYTVGLFAIDASQSTYKSVVP